MTSMSKFFVPSTAHTPADRVREALDKAERLVSIPRRAGPQVLTLLHLLDQAAGTLAELEAAGMDVRAERARFETVQRQLRRRQGRFLAQVGAEFQKERAAVQPDRAYWWWFLDEEVARQRQRRLRRALTRYMGIVIVLAIAWLAYDRFIAPPPHVRQAFQHSSTGESLAEEGDLRAALAEFEAAAALTPDDPSLWLWQGVIHFKLDELDETQVAFDTARSLHETNFDFLLDRSMTHLRAGNLDAARADIEQAIAQSPQSGRGYYVRANIVTAQGDYAAAIADLEHASDLANAAGDTQLEAAARTQRAMVMQLQLYQQPMTSPQAEEEDN